METRETDILNLFDFPIQHFPDRSARWLLQDKENVRGLIEIVADQIASQIDFARLAQLNRSFVSDTLREQESDLIFSVPFHGGSETDELIIYILIEHQSTVDASMGFRVLFYMTQIWDAQRREWESAEVPRSEWRLRPILPVVFYTGPPTLEYCVVAHRNHGRSGGSCAVCPNIRHAVSKCQGDGGIRTDANRSSVWLVTNGSPAGTCRRGIDKGCLGTSNDAFGPT